MLNSNNVIAFISLVVLAAFVLWIVQGIWRAICLLFTRPPAPLDQYALDWQAVSRVTATPVPLPDGGWQMPQIVWKPCDPPMLANNLEVHDPRAPGHDRATCKHCQHKATTSGISYRSAT